MTPAKSASWFTRLTRRNARNSGQPATFVVALFVIQGWAVSGADAGRSDEGIPKINDLVEKHARRRR
jgi:low affinity Fe/Cu permease